MAEPAIRIGIDIGGTFTDVCALGPGAADQVVVKVPTEPVHLGRCIAAGLARLAERGVDLSQVDRFAHGTTVGVNAILQRSGARSALIVTEGFRDILEIARLRLPDAWNMYSRRPVPLIPRERVVTVRERKWRGGVTAIPLDEAEIVRVVGEVDGLNAESVAICLLHSHENGEHELRLKAALQASLPDVHVTCSSELWPQIREYERAMVAVLNAYTHPNIARYLSQLDQVLRDAGVMARPLIARSNGGVMSVSNAVEAPVSTLLSGPASGVTHAARLAEPAGFRHVITFDVGGTSADVSVITDGKAAIAEEAQVGEFPIMLPTVEISSVGAGGGSIARVDSFGVLSVGPESAGADPGPACYGQGGTEPTLTDAFVVAGYLRDVPIGGTMLPDYPAALAAVERVAGTLTLDSAAASEAIIKVAVTRMYVDLRDVLEFKGIDAREYALMAFGGAGPLIAPMLADEFDISTVVVPPHPGMLCAIGAANAELTNDFVASLGLPASAQAAQEQVTAAVATLEHQAREWLQQQAPRAQAAIAAMAGMRYAGQSYEVEVALDDRDDVAIDRLIARFHSEHLRLFTHNAPGSPVEILSVRLRVHELGAGGAGLPVSGGGQGSHRPSAEVNGGGPTREVFTGGRFVPHSVIHRDALSLGATVRGPAILEEDGATCVVPAGWSARIDPSSNVVITRGAIG